MTVLVNCPSCRHVRQVQDRDVCLGVMCPYCHEAYMDTVDRPLGDTEGVKVSLSSSSYDVDVGRWFGYAAAHWTSILGPAIGFLLLEGLVFFALSVLAGLTILAFPAFPEGGVILFYLLALLVMPLLEVGMIIVTLAQLKGNRWSFGDFFGGFSSRYAWPILAFTWMMAGLMLVILTPVWVPVLVGRAVEVPHLMVFGLLASIIFVPVAVYVGVRIGFFGPYLIVDRDFRPMEALQESWDLTTGHFWGLLGVTLLLAGIFVLGYAAGGIGLLLVLPLTGLVRSAGYLLAGGTRPPMKQPERA